MRRDHSTRGHRPTARHLRTVPDRHVPHYNHRRPHRARELTPPRLDHAIPQPSRTPIRRRSILGGLINEYEPAAA
ncbi:hypothetical protein ALI22I_00585 [Saccharothrix sp. ALI-22-I]|nr:hypothetical protein ALI22I_00585 [Saccharothrix sp. ALI-22-I]